ncbi:MAG: hypothetical protein A2Y76_13665 [Planctomycetes bacterium RBG_13_60_9]|nr:MAG: hypothetical protein A2Y76_13665 [Planctomycetes bacterium RBG_13_60_9]
MQAGGIVGQGAAVIRVARAKPTGASPLEVRAEAGEGPQTRYVAFGNPDRRLETGGRRPEVGASSFQPAASSLPSLRAVFEPEGPLKTTGWLSVEQEGGDLCVRRWLDVGNEPQQRAFLGTVASQSGWRGTEDLRGRLSQLAAYLDSHPQGHQPPRTTRIAGWQVTDGNRFVAASYSSGNRRLPNRAIPADAVGNADAVETLVLPIRGLNIPFADVTLAEGDTVTVEWPREQFISIVGLVNRPGNMPYPSGARYTLIQAVAFAGGLNLTADPRYVSVYRLTPDGEIVSTTFQLVNPKRDQQLTETLALLLKPGDVVSAEHTLRTRTNVFFDRVFRISLGLYLTPEDLWND